MNRHKYHFIIPFLAPGVILYALFVLWPYAQSFYVALTRWRGVSANKTFIGLDNFNRLIHDPFFRTALKHNGMLLIALPIITLGMALFFAAMFTQGGRSVPGANAYRVIFFFPQVMSAVAISVLWQFVYHPSLGLLNGFLRTVGLGGLRRTWLGDPHAALWAVTAVIVWQAVGFYMVLFLAGMQSIPPTFYEAATLDGATRWSSFWRITIPLLWNTLQTALIFIGIGALDLFIFIQVMTNGGPNRSSDVVARYMYDMAFGHSEFGYATAIGVAILLMTLTLSLLTLRVTRREQTEY